MSEEHGPCVCARRAALSLSVSLIAVCLSAWMRTVSGQLRAACRVVQEKRTGHAGDTNKRTVSFLPGAHIPLK